MRAARWLVAVVVFIPLPCAAAEEVVTLEAPRQLRAEIDRLRSANVFVRAAAAARLGKDDRNAPFLRFERLAAVTDTHRSAFDAALGMIQARAWKRHANRAKGWAMDRRLDLLCEVLVGCDTTEVRAVTDLVIAVQCDIYAEVWPGPDPSRLPPGFFLGRQS